MNSMENVWEYGWLDMMVMPNYDVETAQAKFAILFRNILLPLMVASTLMATALFMSTISTMIWDKFVDEIKIEEVSILSYFLSL